MLHRFVYHKVLFRPLALENPFAQEEQERQAQNQPAPPNQIQPADPNKQPSWDKTKPLPSDPSKLGPDWKKNDNYKNPSGEEYINTKTGEKIEWNKGRPGPWGPKADRGKDGWHYTPPGGDRSKQMDPGQVLKTAAKASLWGSAVAITIKILETAAEACAEGACY